MFHTESPLLWSEQLEKGKLLGVSVMRTLSTSLIPSTNCDFTTELEQWFCLDMN